MAPWNRLPCAYQVVLIFFLTILLSSKAHVIRIGSRPSPLALIQANLVAETLMACDPSLPTPSIIEISASGDSRGGIQDVPLAMRSVDFTGALDDALYKGEIDLAVHSLKDVPPTHRWKHADHFEIACPLPREDPCDVLVGPHQSIRDIPKGSKIGTSSIRRQAELRSLLPEVEVVNIRGNLEARCQALQDGTVDALILAKAGLKRLQQSKSDFSSINYTTIPTSDMLPGLCQGIVGVVYRKDNPLKFQDWLKEDHDAMLAASVERALLNSLDKLSPWKGRPPLAGLLERIDDIERHLVFRGLLAKPDGSTVLRISGILPVDASTLEASELGHRVGLELLERAGTHFFET